ncbi:hypothetical protein CK503_12060 [Aliifodinibius salipaludis]|uniref:Glycerophosphoryl diester phosphodiesterase membrane domain-containing protein n=1 Tax=Fodinibius salipaludis TaxID=2032627 RepID=A0A2A2G836_9BACT|nr:hypothetical protein [Aliifodinibius salipaludis]PAU93458.1 hypothetical protein CK503_12060 [Aliifodinibius salipaludis]
MPDTFKIKQPRDFGDLITAPFTYIRQHYEVLGKSLLYFVVPLIAVTSILMTQYFSASFEMGMNPDAMESGEFLSNFMATSGTGTFFGVLTMTALAAVIYTHLKLVADQTVSNTEITVDDIWKGLKSNFLAILVISIGVFFATVFGMIALIIPGLFISVKLTLVTAAYVLEDKHTISDAFSRSWHLVTNHWWFTLGLVIVVSILIALLSQALSLPFVIISAISGFSGFADPNTAGTLIAIFYGFVTSLNYVFYSILYLALGFHFYNLVERKEGEGLRQRINEIGNSANA